MENFLELPLIIQGRFDVIWTFILLMVRYGTFFTVVPGLSGTPSSKRLRIPGTIAMSLATIDLDRCAPEPTGYMEIALPMASEGLLGLVLGVLPMMVVAGVQTAGQLASTTMGLGASQLVDPTTGKSMPSVARLFGDLAVLVFLLSGGHRVIVYAVSGLGGEIIPGTYIVNSASVNVFIDQTSQVFDTAVMVSAPVIVALLLTQFVMGLISKAVPTVNIFIVSFPLTIGIGLILSIVMIPEMIVYILEDYKDMEPAALTILDEAQRFSDVVPSSGN